MESLQSWFLPYLVRVIYLQEHNRELGIAKDCQEKADSLCSIRWINDPHIVRFKLSNNLNRMN